VVGLPLGARNVILPPAVFHPQYSIRNFCALVQEIGEPLWRKLRWQPVLPQSRVNDRQLALPTGPANQPCQSTRSAFSRRASNTGKSGCICGCAGQWIQLDSPYFTYAKMIYLTVIKRSCLGLYEEYWR
jgi:hypothetical protein